MGEWVASAASLRWTLPGMTMRRGGGLGDHGADLDGAGVGAHEEAVAGGFGGLAGDLEGVLGVAGGVVFGEVEGFEVVEVGFDLGAQLGGVAEVVEDFDDAVERGEEGVGDAGLANCAGEGDVECRGGGDGGGGFEGGFDLLLELVETDAEGFAGFDGGGFEPGVGDELEASLFAAQPVEAKGFGVLRGRGLADFFGELGEGGFEGGVGVVGEVGDLVGHERDSSRLSLGGI